MLFFKNVIVGIGKDIHYIGGAEALPAPLEPEEEQEALNALSLYGDKEAKSLLVERNLRLVVYIAKKSSQYV